jgi:hypothetical protein
LKYVLVREPTARLRERGDELSLLVEACQRELTAQSIANQIAFRATGPPRKPAELHVELLVEANGESAHALQRITHAYEA